MKAYLNNCLDGTQKEKTTKKNQKLEHVEKYSVNQEGHSGTERNYTEQWY